MSKGDMRAHKSRCMSGSWQSGSTPHPNRADRASRHRELPTGQQHQLDCLAASHAEADAERLGFRCAADDLGVEQVFRLGQRLRGGALADGDGLPEFGRRLQVVDAATDDPGRGDDRTVLALMPAVADPEGGTVLELQFAAGGTWQGAVHGRRTVVREVERLNAK